MRKIFRYEMVSCTEEGGYCEWFIEDLKFQWLRMDGEK